MREGILVPQHHDGDDRYTAADADIVARRPAPARGGAAAPRAARARPPARTTTTRAIAEEAVDAVRHARARAAARRRRSPTTSRPSGSSTRSARCCPRSRRSSRTTSARVLLEVAQEHLESVGEPTRARGREREPGWSAETRPTRDAAIRRRRHVWRSGARRRAHCRRATQAARGRGDVRPRRARLRPDEPRHLARPGPPLAPADGRRARAPAPDARVLDLACGTGDLCRDLAAAGHRPVGVDFSAGMLAPRTVPTHRSSAATRRPSRSRTPVGRRHRVRLRLRNFVDLDAVLRASAPGCCGPAGASPRSTPRCPSTRSSAPATPCGSGARCRSLGRRARATTPTRTATSPRSTAYLPEPRDAARPAARRGLRRGRRARTMTGGSVQLLTGTRA